MSIDVMKQALEALEAYKQAVLIMNDGPDASDIAMAEDCMTKGWAKGYEAIAALRAAIEPAERPPGWWVDGLTATLMREGINKHRAREIAQGYWEAYCEVSDEH